MYIFYLVSERTFDVVPDASWCSLGVVWGNLSVKVLQDESYAYLKVILCINNTSSYTKTGVLVFIVFFVHPDARVVLVQ